MRALALDFRAALTSNDGQQMRAWIETAKQSGIGSFVRFAFGLQKDLSAVLAAVETRWSNGQVEGQINRLKMIKRQMYGRANFTLLRSRVLPYTPAAPFEVQRAPWVHQKSGRTQFQLPNANVLISIKCLLSTLFPYLSQSATDWTELKGRIRRLNVDSTGIGYGMARHIADFKYKVRDVNVGVAARHPEKYANLKAELYWGLRMRFQSGDISGCFSERAIGQLAGIRYQHNARGQVVIESKDDLRKRGVKSPDLAEAVMLAFAEVPLAEPRIRLLTN
jgi:hypothetical protein